MVREIKTVGIAGAGTMGQGIAIACALAGYRTLLYDVTAGLIVKAQQSINHSLDQLVEKGKIGQAAGRTATERLVMVHDLQKLMADVIIEAVVERLDVKQKLFAELEQVNDARTIFATNTSSLSVTDISAGLKHPSRVVGLHFFNPAHLMKLVEVIAGRRTDSALMAVIKKFASSLGKIPVTAKDSPGFIVNRVARPYYLESLKLLEEQAADVETVDALMRASGFKMGPFELMDLIGIDINYAVTQSVYEGFHQNPKFQPSKLQKEKMEAGHLGRKSGKGFYDYSKK
jgi:3-hydroxybutyryl-CoA dehydrogenase